MNLQDNKTLVRRFWEEIWNEGDLSVSAQIVSADFLLHSPDGPINGPEGLRDYVVTLRSALPDVHFELDEEVAEGDKVVTRWTAQGTNLGPLAGIAPTGRTITLTGVSIFRIEDGLIAEDRAIEDRLGMLQQLGALPASTSS